MIETGAKWWNNGTVNKRSREYPGSNFIQRRLPYKRQPFTEQRKKNISKSLKGKTPWNKGKTGIYSEESLSKMREAKKDYVPWNAGIDMKALGYTVWNKLDDSEKRRYLDSRYAVDKISEINYNANKTKLNPENHPRTRCGVTRGHQLDHIYPVYEGYINNIPPEFIGRVENLRVIPWEENQAKGSKVQ